MINVNTIFEAVCRLINKQAHTADDRLLPVGQGAATQGYILDTDRCALLLPASVDVPQIMLHYIRKAILKTGNSWNGVSGVPPRFAGWFCSEEQTYREPLAKERQAA